MDAAPLSHLAQILQLSITPIALISGVGLLVLSMTNRLGRVIDRSRELATEVKEGKTEDADARPELVLLFRRARLLQVALALVSGSTFFAVLMVVTLFAMNVWGRELANVVLTEFGLCLLGMIASIACFLGDIFLSIRWLRLSLGKFV